MELGRHSIVEWAESAPDDGADFTPAQEKFLVEMPIGKGGMGEVLLVTDQDLRRQLQALLLAGVDADVRICIPFVTDCGELRRVREILFEERLELRKAEERFRESLQVGVVIETPAAMLGGLRLVMVAPPAAASVPAVAGRAPRHGASGRTV